MQPINEEYKGYTITTDKNRMKTDDVYRWLSERSYWCKDIPRATFDTSFENSFCIGILKDGRQVGFARFVTDYAVFAYLADVFVAEEHRGIGLSKKMMEILMSMDWVKGLRGLKLQTKDGHGLYSQYGFKQCAYPERIMEISRPDIYQLKTTES